VEAWRARPDAVIRVRVAAHGIELDNSGRRLAVFCRCHDATLKLALARVSVAASGGRQTR